MTARPQLVSAEALSPATAVVTAVSLASAPRLQRLFRYWDGLRDGRSFPPRGRLSPAGMKECLPWIMLFEPVEDGRDFRIRLIGTGLTRAAGVDETGLRVSQSAHRELAGRMLEALRWTYAKRAPFRGAAAAPPEGAAPFVAVEGLWLPLADDGETVDTVLVGVEVLLREPLS